MAYPFNLKPNNRQIIMMISRAAATVADMTANITGPLQLWRQSRLWDATDAFGAEIAACFDVCVFRGCFNYSFASGARCCPLAGQE